MKPKSRVLPDRSARALLARMTHTIDEELSQRLKSEVYALEDGSSLLRMYDVKSRYRLYASRRELIEMLDDVKRRAVAGPTNPFAGLIPQGMQFGSEVAILVLKLPTCIEVSQSMLDYSEESLDAIDKAIRRLGIERLV